MAVIGTFGQFTTARLAIYASQASLSVTGNNIANINTEGYTRQRMDLVSLYSTGQGKYANIFNTNVGYGVLTRGATQLRDPYLDIRYRNENSKLGANEEKADGLYQISNILDEVNKGEEGFGIIEAQFGEFISALEDLNTNIGSEEYDKLVRSAAETLTSYFRKAASDLEDIKVNKVNELNESVSEINNLLTRIRDLNVQIRTQGIYGEKALELRDARNLALDKLSEFIPIDVTYSMERIDQFSEVEKLTVTIKNSIGADGQPIKLVDGIYGGQITIPSRMPVANVNANAQKILKAMQDARENAMKLTKDDVAKRATDTGVGADWQKDLADAIAKAQKNELEPVLAKYKMADTSEAEIKKAADGDADLEKEIRKAIQDANDAGEAKGTERALNKWRQKYADEDAEATKISQTKLYGKYLTSTQLTDGNGNPVVDKDGNPVYEATDDWELATTKPAGYFNYDEKDPINPDSLYLMRVEELVDQRGRLMEDKNTASGKSEIVALTDTTFCAKSADQTVDQSRVDSNALGSLQAIREMLTRKGEYSSEQDIKRDDYATIKRGIQYYERALDNLANKFAEVFNEMNQISLDKVYDMTTPGPVDAKGNPLKAADGTDLTWAALTENAKDNAGNEIVDSDGKPVVVFKNTVTAEQRAQIENIRANAVKVKGYEYYDGGVLISNRGDNNDATGITAANISVSYSWANQTVRVLNTKQKFDVDGAGNVTDHTTLRDNIAHMIAQFDTKRDFYAKEVKGDAAAVLPVFHGTFREVFTAISGVLGDDRSETNGKVENYTISALNLENDRQSVSGVDLNDEATSMMQFSKSYAAACRLLTTIDSMLDTLINGTAR